MSLRPQLLHNLQLEGGCLGQLSALTVAWTFVDNSTSLQPASTATMNLEPPAAESERQHSAAKLKAACTVNSLHICNGQWVRST